MGGGLFLIQIIVFIDLIVMAEYKFNKLKIGSDTFISRQVTGDNNSAEPAGALLLSGAGRTDSSPAGDTWIFYDSMGSTATPWGFKHEQKDNFISFYGAGTRTSYINLQTGNIVGSFTGNLTGNVTGNCSGSSGSCTGNAATATSAYNIISSNGTNLLKSNSSGEITITSPTDLLTINSNGKQTYSLLYFSKDGTRKACTGYYEGMAFISNETSPYPRIGVKDDGTPQYWASNSSSTAQTLLHTGNYTTWCATSGHNHDNQYAPISHGIHWNNFLNRALSSATWGTLTTSNGYTPIFWMDSVNGGGVAFSDYNGQTSMQIDGDYYANEGRSKVWHAGNLTKVSQLTNDSNYTTATGHTHSYLPLSGGILTGTSGLTLQNSKLWVQGGSDAGSNSNRMTLDYGAPTDMKYQSGKRGLMLYSNAIAICDPYNGTSNNDSAWIRHIEETANTSVLEIALGDDGDSSEELRFRKYNTSNQIKYDVLVPHKSGTIALTSDIPTSLPASDVYAWAKASTKPSYTASEVGAVPKRVSTATPSGTTTGWYRCATLSGSNSSNTQAHIISLQTSYHSPQNEHYIFAIVVGYNGQVNITQLIGVTGGHLLPHVRVVYNNSGNCYFDVYKGSSGVASYTNTIRCEIMAGDGSVQTPTLVSDAGGTVFSFDTYYGMKTAGNLCCSSIVPVANATYSLASSGTRFTYGYFSQQVHAAGGFYESSDERLKDIQAPLTTDLEKLSHLRKVYFNFKEDPSKTHIGVIAQDIKELYPEIVTETDEGNLNVDYSKLSVIALDAVDQLNESNKELTKKYNELEEKLNSIIKYLNL